MRLLIDKCDVLVVDKVSKAEKGMDPNVTGRFILPQYASGVDAQRVTILSLFSETHSNATDLNADVVSQQVR